MPRDDLSIDFIGRRMPPQLEHQDAAAVLDEWTNRVANLPAEIAFMQEEIAEKDRRMQLCLTNIASKDNHIQKWIRMHGSHTPNPKEEGYRKEIRVWYDEAQVLQEEKIALAQKTQLVIDKHTRVLDGYIKALQDRGEFPNDSDIPSLLRPNIEPVRPRVEPSVASMPLGQIPNGASMIHARHPNQHPQRMLPAQMQVQQMASTSASSAPATPAASMLLNRQTRESSLGAVAKRQRLTGGLGTLPTASSGLARHSSMTPGTPRAGTPSGGRAGSAGPRSSQKSTKKVAPLGSRQSGVPRKGKPGKSGLSRVKRTGNKNSPSSTNDSELSDAETGSVDDDDENATPPPRKDAEGDEEMMEDPEDADDNKYCTCQRVSFGDMVACDNDSCKYEWFHWECVGLTREPLGTWICPECTKEAAKKEKDKESKKLK
jgi:inhibitor of growth protein 3